MSVVIVEPESVEADVEAASAGGASRGSNTTGAQGEGDEDDGPSEIMEKGNPVEALQRYWYETTARIRMAWYAFNALAVLAACAMSHIAHLFFDIMGTRDVSPSIAVDLYSLPLLLLLFAVLVDEMVDIALDAMAWPSLGIFRSTFYNSVHRCFKRVTVRSVEISILVGLEGLPVLTLILYLACRKGPIELRGVLTWYCIGGLIFIDFLVVSYLITHVHVARSPILNAQMVNVYHRLGHLGELRHTKAPPFPVDAHPSQAPSRRCTRRAKLVVVALCVQCVIVVLHFFTHGHARATIVIAGQLVVLVLGAMSINAYVPRLLGKAFAVTMGVFIIFAVVLFIGAAKQVPHTKGSELPPLCFGPTVHGYGSFGSESHDLPVTFQPPINAQGYGYPICSGRWGNRNTTRPDDLLGVLDLAILSFASSFPGREDVAANLGTMLNGTALQHFRLLEVEDPKTVGRWIVVEFPQQRVRVVAVRGTSNMHDAYADLDLYARISIFQIMNRFTPVVTFLGDEMLRGFMKERLVSRLFGARHFWQPFFDTVHNVKTQALRDGYSLVITGHSLGGALAGAAAAKHGVQAVGFSAPGLFYQTSRFDIDGLELKYLFTEVQPGNDMVPQVDIQRGSVNWIRCQTSAPTCHRLTKTSCELWSRCGDPRGRDWRRLCSTWYGLEHVND